MDIYEAVFVAYNEQGGVNWFSTNVFNSYNKAKDYVDSCVEANMKINENTRINLEFGMKSKNNIRYMPVGYNGKNTEILYGIQTLELNGLYYEKHFYMDRYVVKKVMD